MLTLAVLVGCETPTIDSLTPTTGPEHTVVEVDGSWLIFASLGWDGATIPTPWYGAVFFTVPPGAAVGMHNVTATNSNGTSGPVSFTVTAPVARPGPEIKGVQVGVATFSGGTVDGTIFVYGSNIDVGATLSIDGVAVTTYTHQVLVNDFAGGIDPTTFATPAYHYASLIAGFSGLPAGGTTSLSVTNLDGTPSPALIYDVAATAAELDSDGDGLLDDWEDNGYDADGDGTVDVDLPAMGADKHHMDVFVEVDIMNGLANPPTAGTWTLAENAFATAPILNVDGVQGIALHIDRGQGGVFTGGGTGITNKNTISYTAASSTTNANFYDVKSANFDADRLTIFRYAVWADMQSGGASGRAEDLPSNDFFVTMDDFPAGFQTDQSRAETFVHELGHTLGFGHGGPATDGRVDEPNHLSIMSYCWQFLSVQADCTTCNGYYTALTPWYSEGMARDLDETNLDENAGVCDNVSVDWDGDGTLTVGASANINPDDGPASTETLDDYSEWHNIVYDFTGPGSGWGGN